MTRYQTEQKARHAAFVHKMLNDDKFRQAFYDRQLHAPSTVDVLDPFGEEIAALDAEFAERGWL